MTDNPHDAEGRQQQWHAAFGVQAVSCCCEDRAHSTRHWALVANLNDRDAALEARLNAAETGRRDAAAERDDLQDQRRVLLEYAAHKRDCGYEFNRVNPCDCGYIEAIFGTRDADHTAARDLAVVVAELDKRLGFILDETKTVGSDWGMPKVAGWAKECLTLLALLEPTYAPGETTGHEGGAT